ncbi:hypothetical protein L3Q82_008805 [Scortum barcoo]|uniref:Uncharacterized protein n=1 Tax=Scortum barcoo TaxID=214431 RepID=A0ACB8XCI5_9TELE|nr:hypothetical protein L3Q82_008805 [Scortum barcoo]
MTGSLCRHTAAIKVQGEAAVSDTLCVCVARQTEELEIHRHPVFMTTVLLKRDRKFGSSGLQRALCSSAVRLQETSPETSTNTSTETSRDSRAFRSHVSMMLLVRYSLQFSSSSLLPPMLGQDSPLRWDGKKFEELPVAHIKATYNNTHIQLTDSAGQSMVRTSCGTEGFKNIKKSTPIAAQTAGISAAAKATAKGVKFVRVVVKGIGPGRQAAIKGITMGGLEVVSITDNTPVPHNGCRPRKARRT